MLNYIIVGTGDHGKVVLGYLERCGVEKKNIVFADIFRKREDVKYGCSVIGDLESGFEPPFDSQEIIVAYGGSPYQGNLEREKASKVIEEMTNLDFRFTTIKDPSAITLKGSSIAGNVSVGLNSVIGAEACIHEGVIVNNMVNIEHDVVIKRFANISPNAAIMGNATIEDRVFLGAGTIVRDDVTIGKDCVVAMGSVVVKDFPEKTLIGGNPARKLRSL